MNNYVESVQANHGLEKQNFIFEKLAQAGIVVVTDKAEFERILEREEILQKTTLKRGDNIYGFAHKGKTYLDPDILTSEASVHEYTHLWDNYTKVTNPELWSKGKEAFKNTYLWEEVEGDVNYQDISRDEDLILSECHARITGKIADQILDKILIENGELTKDTVIDWDREVIEYCAKELTGKNILFL